MSQTKAQLINGKSATIEFTGGSASAPAVSFTGDTNTGIYSPGGDQVAISTGGSGRLFVASDGKIGIGSSGSGTQSARTFIEGSGACPLEIDATAGSGGYLTLSNSGSAKAFFGFGSNIGTASVNDIAIRSQSGALAFQTGGANERLRITSAGLVGIGTSSPDRQLTIAGTAVSGTQVHINSTVSSAGIKFSPSSGDAYEIQAGTDSKFILYNRTDEAYRLVVDGSGNVGIGATTPSTPLHVNNLSSSAGINTVATFATPQNSNTTSGGAILLGGFYGDGNGSRISATGNPQLSGAHDLWLQTRTTTGTLTNGLFIDNTGNVGINVTNPSAGASATSGVAFRPGSHDVWFNHANGVSSGTVYTYFTYNSGAIGSISQNGTTAVAYNTTSDYRLKENVTIITDGIVRLQQLKPCKFNFITEPDRTVDGFIAHEVEQVIPEAITGKKDAEDADGNPIYQGIDQSKLVPLLTAALQETIGRIETLEAEVAALKLQ